LLWDVRLFVEVRTSRDPRRRARIRTFATWCCSGKVVPKEGGDPVDVGVSLGLRQRTISGIADGTMDVDGLPCMKDLSFKANKK
jgi:hypothetical protein